MTSIRPINSHLDVGYRVISHGVTEYHSVPSELLVRMAYGASGPRIIKQNRSGWELLQPISYWVEALEGCYIGIDWLRLTSIMNTHGRSRPNENWQWWETRQSSRSIYPSANEQTNSEPLGPSLKNWSGQPSNGGVKTEMSLGWHKVPLQASKHEWKTKGGQGGPLQRSAAKQKMWKTVCGVPFVSARDWRVNNAQLEVALAWPTSIND